MARREIYFEFIPMGQTVKVCAVDSATRVEVAIVGPASAGTEHLKRTALAKLRFVLSKQQAEKENPGAGAPGILA